MKKRLRKRFHTGEFTEYEFQVEFQLAPPADETAVDAMLGAFLDQIEGRGLVAGGSCSHVGDFSFFLSAQKARTPVTDAHRSAVQTWLAGQASVTNAKVGPLEDAWR
jgi:uncharacterized protein